MASPIDAVGAGPGMHNGRISSRGSRDRRRGEFLAHVADPRSRSGSSAAARLPRSRSGPELGQRRAEHLDRGGLAHHCPADEDLGVANLHVSCRASKFRKRRLRLPGVNGEIGAGGAARLGLGDRAARQLPAGGAGRINEPHSQSVGLLRAQLLQRATYWRNALDLGSPRRSFRRR